MTHVAPPEAPGLLDLLDRAVQVAGPIRLFVSRARPDEPALLPAARATHASLLDQALGSLLQEQPRVGNAARRVLVTDEGVAFLIRQRIPAERSAQIERASSLYQTRLLRAWKAVAAASEADALKACVVQLYGDLVDAGPSAERYDVIRGKELVLTWMRESDPNVRQGLARVMVSLGLKPVGRVGHEVVFSGRRHTSDESLFPGDPVEIVEAGWAMLSDAGEVLLHKATVKPVP